MQDITLRVEEPRIRINGEEYPMRLTDVALCVRAGAVLEACAAFGDVPPSPEAVLRTAQDAAAVLEDALGAGAVMRISGGRPVSLPLAVEWLGTLAHAAAEGCADALLAED